MRYNTRLAFRVVPEVNKELIRRARAAGHDNVSIVAREILERALRVKVPVRRRGVAA